MMRRMFSRRTEFDLTESAYAAAVTALRRSGGEFYDLAVSNPTACGFEYDNDAILWPLMDERAMVYDPDPLGALRAREAVAEYYRDLGASVVPSQIVMTTSTSEGYAYLFRLLCDAGDEVLVPSPGYPLFDFLASLDQVVEKAYPLFEDHGWHVDLAALEARITEKTRAILLVHPNNPTGHYTSEVDRAAIYELAGRYGLALIVDEVFLDFGVEGAVGRTFARVDASVLTFILSGMSKIAGLPQMKVAWIAVFGVDGARREAMARLELIGDTFLSMNSPVLAALPHWLDGRHGIQEQILERIRVNIGVLDGVILRCNGLLSRLPVEGGWSCVLRIPSLEDSMELATRMVQKHGVIVHPGSFYGFDDRGWLVVSLLAVTTDFEVGIRRLVTVLEIDSH